MKKKPVILIVVLALVAAVACYVGVRLMNRGKDIIGVTTLEGQKQVIMNSQTGEEFTAGSGKLEVGEGEHIHLSYTLSGGSFDLALHKGEDGNDVFTEADLENLSDSGDPFGKSGISGSGTLDFDAEQGGEEFPPWGVRRG